MEKKTPADKPEQFQVEPLKLLPKAAKPGRKSLPKFDFLDVDFNEAEQERFAFFVWSVQQDHPKLTPFDQVLLELAAIEYVKYLRLVQYEVQKNTSITMARQHPSVQMRSLIDMLSISRKARQGTKGEKDPEREEAMQFIKSLNAG